MFAVFPDHAKMETKLIGDGQYILGFTAARASPCPECLLFHVRQVYDVV